MFNFVALTVMRFNLFFAGAACSPVKDNGPVSNFFGIPHWYEYLPGEVDDLTGKCIPKFAQLNDFWAIALAVVDILLRIGGMAAVVYVMYGGFLYMTSQGEPERIKHAKETVTNALIGIVIVIIAIVLVNFIGASFK